QRHGRGPARVRVREPLQAGSARVADERRVPAEADRLVERARRIADAVDDRLPAALLVPAAKSERADGGAEPAASEFVTHADRLQLADAALVVRPEEAIGREAAVGRLDDAVEGRPIGPRGLDVREARLGHA